MPTLLIYSLFQEDPSYASRRASRPGDRLGDRPALPGSGKPLPGDSLSKPESVRHTEACLAYRFETPGGAALVCSGDTGPCESLIALAKGCDLLILECSVPEDAEQERHLTPRRAGELAAAAGAKKLLLVHFYPDVLATDMTTACRRAYKGGLILGRDRLAVRV